MKIVDSIKGWFDGSSRHNDVVQSLDDNETATDINDHFDLK